MVQIGSNTGYQSSFSFSVKSRSEVSPAAAGSTGTEPHQGDQVSISAEGQRQSTLAPLTEANKTEDTRNNLNPFAQTIVNFIDAQIQRDLADGATPEELASRLKAGMEGFLKGFEEAFAQLEANPEFAGEVKLGVEQTRYQVLTAIDELAQELGVESPVAELPAEPVLEQVSAQEAAQADVPEAMPANALDAPKNALTTEQQTQVNLIKNLSQTLEQSRDTYSYLGKTKHKVGADFHYQHASARSYDLQIKTQDGDWVTVKIGAKSVDVAKRIDGEAAYAQHQSSNLSFEVKGELDEGELRAINQLLEETGKLADKFFAGDLDAAFAKAQAMQMDSTELMAFTLNLKQVDMQRLSQEGFSPGEVEAAEPVFTLADYAKQLLEHAEAAQSVGIGANALVAFFEQLEQFSDKRGLADFAREAFAYR